MKKQILSVFLSFAMIFSIFSVMLPISQSEAKAWTKNQENIVKRADYMYNNAKWTCKKTVAGWGGTFYQGQTYNVPYGQPVYAGSYIGFKGGSTLDDSSIDTYLAAAADANSVFYSGRSHCGGTTAPYYATDCSAFVSWCWGISRKTTYTLQFEGTNLGLTTTANANNLQIGDALNSNSIGHVVLVTDLTYNANGALTQIEITEETPPQLKRSYYTPAELSAKYGQYYIMRYSGAVPSAPATTSMPDGKVDEAEGRPNAVFLRGWAYDEDDTSKNIEVHVYIGGKAGAPGADGHIIIADTERKDVHDVFGCGSNHGFKVAVPTVLTGEQPVYVYAIDNDGSSDNKLIYSTTVTISADTEKPQVSALEVTSTDSNGFVLSCEVSDNGGFSKVTFPTWTKEDQSDMVEYEGTVKNGVASCQINIADFDDFNGKYYTDVYVYDGAGNSNSCGGFSTTFHMPQAHYDLAEGGVGTVRVKGWGYDEDNIDEALTMHVYIGGEVGSPDVIDFHEFIADVNRPDLDEAKGCGPNHGFDIVLPTTALGEQPVYLYVINTGNGSNRFVGVKNVTISKETDKPVASDIKVVSSDRNSYTISCEVTDNIKVDSVKFATWTAANPDNKKWYDGTIENGVATCTVSIADFDNYEGEYVTHVYVYDTFENVGVYPFTTTFNLPEGMVDEVSDDVGGIKVRGWAFDTDQLDEALEVHVYIGGESGDANAEGHIITADKLREDVDAMYGCGKNHGFNEIIKTKLTGEQNVYIYAINKGNGHNEFIGTKKVTITPTLYGDADMDGEISVADVTCIQKNLAGIVDFTEDAITLADVNGNGKVDIRDATYIQLYLAKKISEFPI